MDHKFVMKIVRVIFFWQRGWVGGGEGKKEFFITTTVEHNLERNSPFPRVGVWGEGAEG